MSYDYEKKFKEMNTYWDHLLLSRRALQFWAVVQLDFLTRKFVIKLNVSAKIGCVRRQVDWHSWYPAWQRRRGPAWQRRYRHGNSTTYWETRTLPNNMSLDQNDVRVIFITEGSFFLLTRLDRCLCSKRVSPKADWTTCKKNWDKLCGDTGDAVTMPWHHAQCHATSRHKRRWQACTDQTQAPRIMSTLETPTSVHWPNTG